MDLRCRNKLHGRTVEDSTGLLEVKCRSVFCGSGPGIVVIHQFDLNDGRLVSTKKYKDTPTIETTQGEHNGLGHSPSVRSA